MTHSVIFQKLLIDLKNNKNERSWLNEQKKNKEEGIA